MKRPRVLILGGMHGNETLGIKLVELLQSQPIRGVSTLIANPEAVKANSRFTEMDLNRSFGSAQVPSYETKRASFLMEYVKDFDLVLDFHNTQTPDNNCGFVGTNYDERLLRTLEIFGLQNCVKASYECINKYCPNVVSIEISQNDELDDAVYWYKALISFDLDRPKTVAEPNIFKFEQRVTWQQQKDLNISNWQPFRPIEPQLRNKLGLDGIIVPIFIGSRLTEYYATLLSKERST